MARVRAAEQRGFVSKRKEEPWILEQQEDAEHARLGIPTRRAAVAAFVGRAITELKAPPPTRCSCGALLEDPDHQSVCNACALDARCLEHL